MSASTPPVPPVAATSTPFNDPWAPDPIDWETLMALAAAQDVTVEELDDAIQHEIWLESLTAAEREEYEYWEKFPNRLRPIDWMANPPQVDWLVPGRIHRTGLAQVYGPPYSGKTLYVLDLALSVAAGLDMWLGHDLNVAGPQHVVYVANEGGATFRIQVHAWLLAHPEADAAVVQEHFWLLDGGQGDVLEMAWGTGRDAYTPSPADSVHRLLGEIHARGFMPAMIVYDTQIDLAPGINENDNAAMVTLLRQIKADADKARHLAVVVHHSGHTGDHARGASGQRAKTDVQVQVVPVGKGHEKTALWSKAKIKGAPQPETDDNFESYQMSGSEGAAIRSIGQVKAALAAHLAGQPSDDEQRAVLDAIDAGHVSARAISDETGIERKSRLPQVLTWMQEELQITKTGTGSQTRYARV
ncbi:AAA family ATPase [Cellulosimicrobium sp. SL-1]|uniref:AAA family ATPase n=1 Tax=Cellulosimicrobium sp. SL-1 TaxID=2699423 RepID=UPI0013D081EB|nr:AAA family ATPase [Cellulosimicrobium sp. SL-1]